MSAEALNKLEGIKNEVILVKRRRVYGNDDGLVRACVKDNFTYSYYRLHYT